MAMAFQTLLPTPTTAVPDFRTPTTTTTVYLPLTSTTTTWTVTEMALPTTSIGTATTMAPSMGRPQPTSAGGNADRIPGSDAPEKYGFGCSSTGGPSQGAAWLILVGLLGLRRSTSRLD